MIIRNNLSAVNAHRVLKFNEWETDKTIARLASGERITKSADDASGLAVSEKLRTQVQGLRQAERNTEDGISFVQTADGYLNQLGDLLPYTTLFRSTSSAICCSGYAFWPFSRPTVSTRQKTGK